MVCGESGDTLGLAFFTKHILLLSIFTQRRKTSIKFKQRDHLSKKRKKEKRESNTVRKSESSTCLERSDSLVINWRQQRATTPTRTTWEISSVSHFSALLNSYFLSLPLFALNFLPLSLPINSVLLLHRQPKSTVPTYSDPPWSTSNRESSDL